MGGTRRSMRWLPVARTPQPGQANEGRRTPGRILRRWIGVMGSVALAAVGVVAGNWVDWFAGPPDEPATASPKDTANRLPIPRDIACRPRIPRSQDPRVAGEVRNLIEATYKICLAHPHENFHVQAVARVKSFRPAGHDTVDYDVEGDRTGYVKMAIYGPKDVPGSWAALWQQNSSSDCWSLLTVTDPQGRKRIENTEENCHPQR